ncbi:energy transducer TonB [Dechloromonas denitrificans]|nr:TonB family protein [Dechloromonas denitrificans]
MTGKNRLIPIIIAASFLLTDRFIAGFINALIPQASLHFLMTRTNYRLLLALAVSLLLHLLPFIEALLALPAPPPQAPPLQATLRAPPAMPAQVPLSLPEPSAAAPKTLPPPQSPKNNTKVIKSWAQEIQRQFLKQQKQGIFYPAEAIAKGLEGDVLVLIVLNPDGQVVGARVEESSGSRLLDDGALQAARALRALPADTPRETLLPIRFRLK